jgi:hypothetical protein
MLFCADAPLRRRSMDNALAYLALHRAVICAGLGIFVGLIRYGTYIHSILKGETHPHVFSWLNWCIMIAIGAYAQYRLGGGPSVWVLVMVTVVCAFITLLSLKYGEKDITRSDRIAFIGALLAIPVWQATHNPFYAILIVIFIDCLTWYPTVRKTWVRPNSEPPGSYFWAGLRYFFAMLAVPEFTAEKLFYPFFLMICEWVFMVYVFQRRKWLKRVVPAA